LNVARVSFSAWGEILMGLSTDVLNAIWSRLQADSAMSALLQGGTMFRFNGQGVLTRLEIMPAICPVFAMAPAAGGHHWPPAKRRRGPAATLERRTAFVVEMATAGEDSRNIVNLAEGFEDFMTRQFQADGFGLGSTLAEAEYSNESYVPKTALTKHIELWQFTATMVCKFRIT
jgi:hypothetical protein